MLGPLSEESPGGRKIGRLRTREVQEIGKGSERSSGLPPRILVFTAKSQKMGSGSAQVLKSYYVPTFLLLGAETGSQGPHFPRFLRSSEGTPGIFFAPETPPRELSASPQTTERGGFRGPCFGEMRRSGNRESRQRTDGRQITDDKGRRFHKKEERRKMTEGERRK